MGYGTLAQCVLSIKRGRLFVVSKAHGMVTTAEFSGGRVAEPFEPGLKLRVPDPSRFFEGSEGLVYFLSDDLNSFSTSHHLALSHHNAERSKRPWHTSTKFAVPPTPC